MSFRVKIVLPIILVMIAVTSLLGVWLSLSFDEARAEERRNVAETLRRHVEDWNRQERARLGRLFELQLAAWLNATGFQQDSYLYLYTDLQKWVQRGYLTAAHIWDGADQYQYSIPSLPVSAETHPAPTDGERAIFARIRRTMQPHVEGLVAYAPVRIVVNPPEQTPPGPRPHGGAGHAGASRSDPAAGEKSAEAGGAGATDRDQPRGPPVEVGTEGAPIYVVRLHMNFTPPTVEDRPIQLAWEKAAGQTIQTTIVVLLAGTLAAVVAVYILLAGQVIRPLEQLAAVARQVGKGDYRTRVPPTRRTDEVGALMTTFGRMVEELDQYKSDMEGKVESATRKFHETQKGLIVAQRLAAMGSLASGIAHEINNPLSGMLNAVRRLTRKSGGRDAQLEAYLELIEDGLLRIQTIVQKLLQFSPRRVARGEVDLANVIERAVALKAYDIERQGLALSRDLAPDLPRVAGDANEVLQVVLNLVINAMDACAETGRGGDITIRAAREGQGEVRIDVADTGCGMNDEQKSRCFDMFYSTKAPGKGTGLGLVIVHDIIKNHGGRITVDSSPGHGATFHIFLPISSPVPAAAAAGGAPVRAPPADRLTAELPTAGADPGAGATAGAGDGHPAGAAGAVSPALGQPTATAAIPSVGAVSGAGAK